MPVLALAAFSLLATACMETTGSGIPITVDIEQLERPQIQQLVVNDDVAVNVIMGSSQAVHVTIDDNFLNLLSNVLEFDVEDEDEDDRELVIGLAARSGSITPVVDPTIGLTLTALRRLEVSGDSDVQVQELSGGSLELVVDGDGRIVIDGEIGRLEVELKGEADVDLSGLVAETVELVKTGDGVLRVQATNAIEGELSGDGDVMLTGNPGTQNVELTGEGRLVGE